MEENPRKVLVSEERALQEEKAGKRAKKSSKESVRNRRVIFGIIPCVKITSLNRERRCPSRGIIQK